jgi:hypothetical protein
MDHASINQDREDLARYRALYGPLPTNKKERTVKMVPWGEVVTEQLKIWNDFTKTVKRKKK